MDIVTNILNRGLPRSPRARGLCKELAGKRIGVNVRGFKRLVVESNGDVLQLSNDSTRAVNAELTGGPVSLLALSGPTPEAVVQRGDVQIAGDAELAQKFRELIMLLRPDWEEELSLAVGDIPAHHLGKLARAALAWTRRAAQTTLQNAAEYLAHEKRDLVPRAEGEQYLQGVDALREDVDRLEARVDWIIRKSKS